MKLYRTIVADPPWQYRVNKGLTGSPNSDRVAEAHYPTMTMREIASLPIRDLAEDQAHLYLWVTNPRLFGDRPTGKGPRVTDTLPVDILEAWGFTYQTTLTWVKTGQLGLGYYFRGATEHVLFGTRGGLGIDPSVRQPNTFAAPRRAHSEKPDAFLDLVERVSPGPYLELFARRQRLGWDTWGNEAFEHVQLQSVASPTPSACE